MVVTAEQNAGDASCRKDRRMKKTDVRMEPMIKEIKEYHAYHGDRKVEFVRMLKTKSPINVFLLVRVVDASGRKLSMIHSLDTKGNGDYYVTELDYDYRSHEDRLVRRFEDGEDDDE